MKLNEIKELAPAVVDLLEGVIPIHITMTLDQIVASGHVTNSVQTFVLAGLIDMFKDGGPYRWPRDLNAYSMSTMGTASDMIEAVNALSADEQVQISEWLLGRLQEIGSYESDPLNRCGLSAQQWIMMILQKQND